jgi:valyl-tRNA synthetase
MAELSKTYDPKTVEPKWYQRWLDAKAFRADANSSKPAFSIVIPPPNVTGVLTLGHVLNNTIQDILARRARMQGREVLWLPGRITPASGRRPRSRNGCGRMKA